MKICPFIWGGSLTREKLFFNYLNFTLSARFLLCFNTAAAAAKSLQSYPILYDPIDGSPPGSPTLGGENTGVGCHYLLQCMKVKSESEVAQSCLTLSDPMDCSPPGSSVHGIFQARVLEWGAIARCFNTVSLIIIVVPQKKELFGSEFPVRKIAKQTQDQQWKYSGGNS